MKNHLLIFLALSLCTPGTRAMQPHMFLETLAGKSITVNVDQEHDTINTLKQRIFETSGIAIESQNPILNGKVIPLSAGSQIIKTFIQSNGGGEIRNLMMKSAEHITQEDLKYAITLHAEAVRTFLSPENIPAMLISREISPQLPKATDMVECLFALLERSSNIAQEELTQLAHACGVCHKTCFDIVNNKRLKATITPAQLAQKLGLIGSDKPSGELEEQYVSNITMLLEACRSRVEKAVMENFLQNLPDALQTSADIIDLVRCELEKAAKMQDIEKDINRTALPLSTYIALYFDEALHDFFDKPTWLPSMDLLYVVSSAKISALYGDERIADEYKIHLMPLEGDEARALSALAKTLAQDEKLRTAIDEFKIKLMPYARAKDSCAPKIVIYVHGGAPAAQYALDSLYAISKDAPGHTDYAPRYNEYVTDFLYFAQSDGETKNKDPKKFEPGEGEPFFTGKIYALETLTPTGKNGGYHLKNPATYTDHPEIVSTLQTWNIAAPKQPETQTYVVNNEVLEPTTTQEQTDRDIVIFGHSLRPAESTIGYSGYFALWNATCFAYEKQEAERLNCTSFAHFCGRLLNHVRIARTRNNTFADKKYTNLEIDEVAKIKQLFNMPHTVLLDTQKMSATARTEEKKYGCIGNDATRIFRFAANAGEHVCIIAKIEQTYLTLYVTHRAENNRLALHVICPYAKTVAELWPQILPIYRMLKENKE